ncbi:MAG: hypothetical protein AB1584_04240 [Pseudomonadota bacterium]
MEYFPEHRRFLHIRCSRLALEATEQSISTDSPRPLPTAAPEESSNDRRAQNRDVLQGGARKLIFYFTTFAALYLSVMMPPLFKALLSKNEALLSQARFIGNFLPGIPVSKSYLQVPFFLIAASLYLPLLLLTETIASLLAPIVDSFVQVTERFWSATTMFVFLLFCVPIAGTSVFLFYEKSFADSLITVIFVLFFSFVFAQTQERRR